MRNLQHTYDNGRGVFKKCSIIIANQNKLLDTKFQYYLSLCAI